MFPKMQFRDTIDRVERLCRSKRMHVCLFLARLSNILLSFFVAQVALSTWRDLDNAPAPEDDDNADAEDDQAAAQHPPTSSPARITLEPGGPPVRQSQAHAEPDEDEEEIWRDMMDVMESQNQARQKSPEAAPGAASRKEPEEQYDAYDEEDWAIMDEMDEQVDSGKPPNTGAQPATTQSAQPAASADAVPSPGPDHEVSSDAPPEPLGPSEDEEDDFYAMYEP
jgi:replication fork protection complex subunit Csm3/Swi3